MITIELPPIKVHPLSFLPFSPVFSCYNQTMQTKTIYLARHAKSSWDSGASSDYERPLSARGFSDAQKMAIYLSEQGWKPEYAIVSPALRAKQTFEAYMQTLTLAADQIDWNPDFYAAYTVTLLHALTRLPENISSVMLLGHNPSVEDALFHLCDATDLKAKLQKNGKLFTTGNVARLLVDSSWKNLSMAEAKLDALIRPRAL